MRLVKWALGPYATNTYYLACPKTGVAVVIDPALGAFKQLKELPAPSFILLTHSHFDHIADLAPLKDWSRAPVYVHQLDEPNLRHPGTDGLPLPFLVPPSSGDILLGGGEKLQIGELSIHVMGTPGHSPGGICYYLPSEATVFTGDTLFAGSYGRFDFPTSSASSLLASLKTLLLLPPETTVLPGHGEETTIGREKKRFERDSFGDLET
jgi:glyoxylase-like metal-dependent hydrolase (beta-lactamase superfamily II)